jgi:hypothetical protein
LRQAGVPTGPGEAGSMRLIAIIMVAALSASCGGPTGTADEALRGWVDAAETAAEDLDRRTLVSMISENYADARGNDRDGLDRLLRLYFLQQKTVALVMTIDELTVSDESAAEIMLTVAGIGTTGRAFGVNADAYQFSLELENVNDEWKLIGASWGELGQPLH